MAKVVSLIGLPGAGKTTLAKALLPRLGSNWTYLGTGEALRASGRSDSALRKQLDGGYMAPETMVRLLVANAIDSCHADGGLILDGFPRSAPQVAFALSHFKAWIVLHLDVRPTVALRRLRSRRLCDDCGASVKAFSLCPDCGSSRSSRRGEDAPEVLQNRFCRERLHLDELLLLLNKTTILEVNGNTPGRTVISRATEVVSSALLTT